MTHLLDDARAQMREGHTSAQWELIAREKVMRTLLETGEYTADVLADLNIPREYRQHVHGAATGFFSGEQPYMEEAGRRKSERPSRKGGKNTVFVISAKGRRELPKLLRDLQRELPKLSTPAQLNGGSSGEVGAAVQLGEEQEGIVGSSPAAEDVGRAPRSGRRARSGETHPGVGSPADSDKSGAVTSPPTAATDAGSPDNSQNTHTGQNRGKSDQGRLSESTSSAAVGAPGVLQLDGKRKAPSMFDPWSDAA